MKIKKIQYRILLPFIIIILALAFTFFGSERKYPETAYLKKHLSWKQPEVVTYFSKLAKEKGQTYAYGVLAAAPLPPNVEIHVLAHAISDVLYEKKGAEGIAECSDEFRNACSHAIVIGLFTEQGEGALDVIDTACRKAPGGKAAYTMCYHGLGHGILAYYGYDFKSAVATCRKTGTFTRKNQESIECIGGAVMELVGGGFHDRETWIVQRKKYLSGEDLLAPCNSSFMPDDARGMCYLHLTSHFVFPMEEHFSEFSREDVKTAFAVCNSLPLERIEDRAYCFGGVSKEFIFILKKRDVRKIPSFTNHDLRRYADLCLIAPADDGITACIRHSVNTFYWGGAGSKNLAVRFCRVITDEKRRADCFSHFLSSVVFYAPNRSTVDDACRSVPYRYRTDCFKGEKNDRQEAIKKLLEQGEISKSLDLVVSFYQADPNFAGQCHTLTHQIGEAAFWLFSQKRSFVVTSSASSCAYGFYHGFAEEMFRSKESKETAVSFCKYVGKQSKNAGTEAFFQCFHGIGHGVSNSHDKINWGKEGVIRDAAVSVCRSVSRTKVEFIYCVGGVYNGIANYYRDGQYDLTMDMSDPFRLCAGQKGDERTMCIINLAVSYWHLSQKDLDKTIAILSPLTDTERQAAVREVATKFWNEKAYGDHATTVSKCRKLSSELSLPCLRGYAIGMFEYGLPESEYKEALAFCALGILNDVESLGCYDGIISLISKWYSEKKSKLICRILPGTDLRETCLRRVEKILK